MFAFLLLKVAIVAEFLKLGKELVLEISRWKLLKFG
jgi:hypothetical protein